MHTNNYLNYFQSKFNNHGKTQNPKKKKSVLLENRTGNAVERFHRVQRDNGKRKYRIGPSESVGGITKLCRSLLPDQDYLVMAPYLYQNI